jgi:hypothetical protein
MPHRPRHQRDLERAHRAAAAARDQGKPATEVAVAQIAAAFDEASAINAFKQHVERWLRLGPQHPAARARFGARVKLLRGRDLDAAVVLVERWWLAERKAFQIANAFGRGSRLSLEVLSELRLSLRLLRRKRMNAEFPAIVAALGDEPVQLAAAE